MISRGDRWEMRYIRTAPWSEVRRTVYQWTAWEQPSVLSTAGRANIDLKLNLVSSHRNLRCEECRVRAPTGSHRISEHTSHHANCDDGKQVWIHSVSTKMLINLVSPPFRSNVRSPQGRADASQRSALLWHKTFSAVDNALLDTICRIFVTAALGWEVARLKDLNGNLCKRRNVVLVTYTD